MADSKLVPVNLENVDAFISHGHVVLDFFGKSWGPCKALAPVLEKVAAEFAGKVVVGKVDVDDAIDVFERFGVMAMPTLLFFKNGEPVDQANFLSENAFRQRVQELVAG